MAYYNNNNYGAGSPQYTNYNHQNPFDGGHAQDWDNRSAKSYNSYHSQAHPTNHSQYEMSQVSLVPSRPPLPYQPQGAPDYPPPSPQMVPPRGAYSYPDRPGTDAGYSMARERMMRRRSVRKVALQEGNLVLDVPVPSHLHNGATSEEMTKARYTAATCDPDDFVKRKYTLRPYLYGRQTELFIVMTMYNEDEVLFVRTMNAVIKNIVHLCSRDKSKTWGPNGWQKVVVCVISDGRNKANPRTLKVLSLMGCYQEGIPKDTIDGKDVTAHIFEFTSQTVVTETGEVSKSQVPIQILFCLKEQNKKKLNSHRWFFNAFGPLIKPNVCILLDVGTKPTATSIYELWKCFDKHPNVGGACGEICVDYGKGCSLLLTSPLAASQNFEYKMSNILDKPLE
ncbi:Chitin synthase, class 2, partial [Tulasnella sp. 419]